MANKHLIIAGTRGIPATHGGFETFAEKLALYLVEKGWDVTVSCQTDSLATKSIDFWNGIKRQLIPVKTNGAMGTVLFDLKSTLMALRRDVLVLVLGYNTAVFSLIYKVCGIPNIINMDGIEWKRKKWNTLQKSWLYFNERFAGLVGTRLIADHPEIKKHLTRGILGRKDIEVIPYGADPVPDETRAAGKEILQGFSLKPYQYSLVVARPEPENQVLEIVEAFAQSRRDKNLVVLGSFTPKSNDYHKAVLDAASNEVIFPGAIYDKKIVGALRAFASLYIHGHTVGGTNPSLVEALASGSPVLADDNVFNRWVTGDAGRFFSGKDDCRVKLDALLENKQELEKMRRASLERYQEAFTWEKILSQYENLLHQTLNSQS